MQISILQTCCEISGAYRLRHTNAKAARNAGAAVEFGEAEYVTPIYEDV